MPQVRQMAPAPQPVDPRLVAQVLQQMQLQQQQPMSQHDSIVIQNRPEPPAVVVSGEVDPFQQQAINLTRSPLGQKMVHGADCGYQQVAADEAMNPLIAATAQVIQQAFGQAQGGQGTNYVPYSR
ncbi:hypothetical protein [Synechococcus sp. WH 8016]|uniref:hypothetical protein n=1 Tax=Synechococcus sp. WH 8016 TaxID=166318 RepID=UPI001C1DEF67|nr:hypothetical protein [Synechococcus sp. WH 8016]